VLGYCSGKKSQCVGNPYSLRGTTGCWGGYRFEVHTAVCAITGDVRGNVVRVEEKTSYRALVKTFDIGINFSVFGEAERQQLLEYAEKVGRE